MKKILLTVSLLTLPFFASAQGSGLVFDYSKVMSERLAFGLNRNARLYNGLVNQSIQLAKKGKDLSAVNAKLAETKIIIDRGQARLANFSTPKKSYSMVRLLVKEIIQDIRQSYAKIKEIKLLIKNIKYYE